MKKLILFLFSWTIILVCDSQNLYFCTSHSAKGEPIGAVDSWSMNPNKNLEVLIKIDKEYGGEEILVGIERLNAVGLYEDQDVKTVTPVMSNKWVTLSDPGIESSGYYRFTAFSSKASWKIFGVGYLYLDADGTEAGKPVNRPVLPDADYKEAGVMTGMSIDSLYGGIPVDDYQTTIALKGKASVQAAFEIRNGFSIIGTNAILMQLFKEEGGVYKPTEKGSCYALPLRSWAGFYYTFYKAGNYKFEFKTDKGVFIKDYDFTVRE
jgi:hypothetical protein